MTKPTRMADEIRNLQSALMGTNIHTSIERNLCVRCKRNAAQFTDEVSRREFGISGLCQECQDEVFREPEDIEA